MCCKGVKKTVKSVKNIATGYAYLALGVNPELSKKRMKICNNCPFVVQGIICSICGCELHAKTRLPNEQCADEKNRRWLPELNYKSA